MGHDYFNKIDFFKALDLQEKYPIEALSKFQEYIERYPDDYSAYPYYISTLIIFGRVEEADKLFKKVEMLANGNNTFKYNSERVNRFDGNMLFTKIKLLAYQEKYKELRKIYLANYELIKKSKRNFQQLNVYCKKRIGIPIHITDNSGYMYRQIAGYSEELFIDHIKKHLADYNVDSEKVNDCIFSVDFPVMKIIDEIKKYIPSDKGLFVGMYEDAYVFKYDNCGRDTNRLVDYFKVICFHNTSDFITMCPVYGYDYYPSVDLNYLKEYNDEKIKRRSAIDRFNNRYNR